MSSRSSSTSRRRGSKSTGSFFVGDDKSAPTAGAALSIAQNLAVQAKEPKWFYVRDALGNCIYQVERNEDGIVLTHQTEGRTS